MAKIFQNLVFEEPSSIYITAVSAFTLLFLASLGISEAIGKHLKYSKFWNVNSTSSTMQVKIPSRAGFLLLYSPAAIFGVSSFFIFPGGEIRFSMVKAAVSIHFCKRVFENIAYLASSVRNFSVTSYNFPAAENGSRQLLLHLICQKSLFVHKYSGAMMLDSAILISSSYLFAAAGIIYLQSMTNGFAEPSIDLKYLGLVVFSVGTCGNFYHHYLLSNLRKKNETGYKIPRGGLFRFVVCPHYVFEILAMIGISLISQTLFAYSVAIGSALYLTVRSYVTRKWYLSKFEDFPKNVKALIPFVF